MASELLPLIVIGIGALLATQNDSNKEVAQSPEKTPVAQVVAPSVGPDTVLPVSTAAYGTAAVEYSSSAGTSFNVSTLDRIFSGMTQDCAMDQTTALAINQFATGKVGELGSMSKAPAYPVSQTDSRGQVWQGRLMPVNATFAGHSVAYVFTYKSSDGQKLKYGMMLNGNPGDVSESILSRMTSGTYDHFNMKPMGDKNLVQLTCSV